MRITHDPRTSQILVIGPPDAQEQIGTLLAQFNGAPQRGPKVLPLRHVSPNEFEAELSGMFGKTLPMTVERGGDWARYTLDTRAGQISMIVDRKAGQVALEGPVKLADAWAKVIDSIDNRPQQTKGDTRIVPLAAAKTSDVIKAISALRDGGGAAAAPATVKGASDQKPANGRFINMIFQPRGDGDATGANNALAQGPGVNPDENSQPGQPQVAQDNVTGSGELIGPVQIEFLEGLDVIVVRGNPRDVDRVMQIINEIEQLSTTTQPKIEIYPLKFVSGQTLATLVTSLYDQTGLATRQGRVSVTWLGKPNSLLLIGRPEAVQSVIDLIQRLDQPANPNAMFQVFPLKNASAQAAQTIVQNFFTTRIGQGLSTASVVLDYRTNSLIVQASPRDLQEVEALLKKIDASTSPAVNELRMFPLKNSLADELAPVLQAAITGQPVQARGGQAGGQQGGFQGAGGALPGQFGGGGGGGGFGAGGGGANAAAPGFGLGAAAGGQQGQAGQQQRSARLQFVTVDPEGRQRLSSGILTDVHVTADSRANTLLVSAPGDSMELIAALIHQLDNMPTSTAQIKVFEMKNGDAVSMVQMLQQLFGARVTGGGGGGGAAGGGANLGGPIQVEDVLVPVRFSVDQRTNSIIASGSPEDLLVVEAILAKLDHSDIRSRKSIVYRLKNVYATAVATEITTFLTQERALEAQFQPAGTINPFEEIEREVVVVADQSTNSLIVSATPRFFDEIQKIIEELDRRPPMIMIQVLIAEVTLNNIDEFGVELGLQDAVLFDRSLVGATNFITRDHYDDAAAQRNADDDSGNRRRRQ